MRTCFLSRLLETQGSGVGGEIRVDCCDDAGDGGTAGDAMLGWVGDVCAHDHCLHLDELTESRFIEDVVNTSHLEVEFEREIAKSAVGVLDELFAHRAHRGYADLGVGPPLDDRVFLHVSTVEHYYD